MVATLTRPAGRVLDVPTIEKALDGLLRAILGDEQRRREAETSLRTFRLYTLADLEAESYATRDEELIGQLADDPVGTAGRQAIRRCGEMLHRMGGFDLMQAVAESVADLDPSRYGQRAVIIDHAWNGVGGVWWS